MRLILRPSRLSGTIVPPPSKSQAHRLLITAALAEGESAIDSIALSNDISATIGCMRALGAEITVRDGRALVRGIGGRACLQSLPELDCGESGSTLRFLIPIALAAAGGAVFRGHGRLMQRPQEPYFALFREQGIAWKQEGDTLRVEGRLKPGHISMPGNVSSQFITGLLYALPLLEGDSYLEITEGMESAGYIDMTLQALAEAGILPEKVPSSRGPWSDYHISGGCSYRPVSAAVEPDWSQAGFWLAAQCTGHPLAVSGLRDDSTQGDRVARQYFRQLAGPGPVTLDVSGCPDLVPALAAAAALRAGEKTSIVGAARLRIKESDRLAAVTRELGALGAEITEAPDALYFTGVPVLHGGACGSHNDHRIAMMTAVAAASADGPVRLDGAESVAKSYPDFWDRYRALGGIAEEADT